MTITGAPGETREAILSGAISLAGTLGVRIVNTVTDVDFLARTTAGITQPPATTGIYKRPLVLPTVATSASNAYLVVWDDTVTFTSEELIVTSSAPGASIPGGFDLCTLADVKLAVGIPTATTTSDALIATLITAASAAIERKYQREFAPRGTLTRTFPVVNDRVDVTPFDLQSVSAMSLYPEGTPLAVARYTDFDLGPVTPTSLGTYTSILLSGFLVVTGQSVFRYGYANLSVTGVWGATAIPTDVARAATLTAAAWLDRGADQIAGMDSVVRPDGSTFAASWAIPTAAHNLLSPYARWSYA